MSTLLTFDTTHHALWAEEVAGSRGIPVDLVPAPAAAHARCNLAIETLPARLHELTAALRETGVPFGIYAAAFQEEPGPGESPGGAED